MERDYPAAIREYGGEMMGLYLNSIAPYDKYKMVTEDPYFIDKSALLEELIPSLGREQRFVCITRPRRFGKTIMANMVGAYFGRAKDSRNIFDRLEIAKLKQWLQPENEGACMQGGMAGIESRSVISYGNVFESWEQWICRDQK